MIRYVTAHAVLGEPETGLWCDECQLPARCRFPVSLIHEAGVVADWSVVEACLHCEGYDEDEDA